MRPDILNPLFAEVEALKGVGPQVAKLLERLGLTRVVDVALSSADRVRSNGCGRRPRPARCSAATSSSTLTPFDIRESRSGRGPMRVFASDGDGNTISLIYFGNPGWAKRSLPLGEQAHRSRASSKPMATSGRSSIPK